MDIDQRLTLEISKDCKALATNVNFCNRTLIVYDALALPVLLHRQGFSYSQHSN